MHEADEKKKSYLLAYHNLFYTYRRKNNHDFATTNQLGNSKKSDPLLQQNSGGF